MTKKGERSSIYSKTLLKGNPVEKNTIIDSTMGHCSMSLLKIKSSEKFMSLNSSNFFRFLIIFCICFDFTFLDMAQMSSVCILDSVVIVFISILVFFVLNTYIQAFIIFFNKIFFNKWKMN